MDIVTIMIYALTALIGYVSYVLGTGTRENVIAETVGYLIEKGFLLTDEAGDIKVRK